MNCARGILPWYSGLTNLLLISTHDHGSECNQAANGDRLKIDSRRSSQVRFLPLAYNIKFYAPQFPFTALLFGLMSDRAYGLRLVNASLIRPAGRPVGP